MKASPAHPTHILLAFTFVLLFTSPLLAREVIGNDKAGLGITGVIRGGLVTDAPPDATDLGPFAFDADLARVGLDGRLFEVLKAQILLEAQSGDVQLLDLFLDWQMTEIAKLRVGRFRTFFGASFFEVGLPAFPLQKRPDTTAVGPLRSDGLMLSATRPGGRIRPEVLLGVFWGDLLQDPRGTPAMAMSALRLHFFQSWLLHLALSNPLYESEFQSDPLVGLSLLYDDEVDLQFGVEGVFKIAPTQAGQHNTLSAWAAYALHIPGGQWAMIPAVGIDVNGPSFIEDWHAKARGEIRFGRKDLSTWLRFGTVLGPNDAGVDVDTYLLLQVGLD